MLRRSNGISRPREVMAKQVASCARLGRWLWRIADDPNAFATTCATIVIAIFTIVLARVSRLQNADAEKFFRIAQAPHVFIKKLMIDPPKVGQKITASIEVINTGNLPALNFALALNIEAREDFPKSFGVVGAPIYETDLPPKLEVPPTPIHSNQPLSQADWSAFNAGTKRIYAYGMLQYKFLPDQPVILRPFCRYLDNASDRIWGCPQLNTQYRDQGQ